MADIPAYEHVVFENTNPSRQSDEIKTATNAFVNSGRNVVVIIHSPVVIDGVLTYSAEICATRRTLSENIIKIVVT
ncbi:TPA: hypothetical protein DIU27_02520 [Candidatus Collierbacteria bacterium]|uniref:Uncharacterized protein n=1 Tax=Candidatus Collierbacteria bacterium GW2011_GWB2_44_22 TaxID=1618387 RepID=A0A0G1KUB1_9BACT|nr:MAG: hypothetical protein UW31_C0008G0015 [Candidatus Collierbacteria bacterium GW2011_GWA2_44_13]KKT51014.1 MAG: hypothetical protein UW42_C0009G0002 [Candidatus Collierbacteria bacterium GW2011_GWB1_44_197]KKT51504.1 MAG: hypothetical protein UW44_C0011G0015 [Candidatus Collierbacteria bacterium GW2011_GWB2_44_22]KKT62241.1 MAG: hypothetical protein UW56_C0009G0015 [Candidatus Collierbacteria bacterium GW2011_GWD1_44_27]KKT66782.1 MAG: hypothetical protein UW58_C0003G0015 [Candidatus Colli